MINILKLGLIFFNFLLIQTYYIQEGKDPKTITKIAFGSNYLNRENITGEIFTTILNHNPDLWIWLGNSVNINIPNLNIFSSSPSELPNWDFVKKVYNKVKNDPNYTKLKTKIPTIGSWGDYEYGINYGNSDNLMKESFKQHYLDFLEVNTLDQRRNKVNIGIYSTYSFGTKNESVRIILLDLKYNKSPYSFNDTLDNQDMLGKDQWEWLENIFKRTEETFTFIGISNPILSHDRIIAEKWFEKSRKKIFDLIGKYKRNGVIFISGGIGYSEISKTFCPLPNIGYNLYEITSSGLGYNKKLSSIYSKIYHNDYSVNEKNYNGINFGQIEINWGENNDITKSFVLLQIYGENDVKKMEVKIDYKNLVYKETKDFYLDENNLKKIRYMNISDDNSCEREIYHRVKTPFMHVRYYFQNPNELPIAIASVVLIIFFTHFLIHRPLKFILITLFLSGIIYLAVNVYDILNYNNFQYEILKE